MSLYIGTISSGPSTSLILDLQSMVSRVAALLQRSDLNSEIEAWINFSQRELFHQVNMVEARVGFETTPIPMPAPPVVTPENYFFMDLPQDFDKPDRVYFKDTTDSNNVWGLNLSPLPRKFYAGDVVDIERLMNVSSPATGTPNYYWIDGLRLGIYPALATQYTGKVQLWYYKVPPDLIAASDEPLLQNKYRHYLIWMALYWGKALLEQGSDAAILVKMWEAKFNMMITKINTMVLKRDNPIEVLSLPDVGVENADEVY